MINQSAQKQQRADKQCVLKMANMERQQLKQSGNMPSPGQDPDNDNASLDECEVATV